MKISLITVCYNAEKTIATAMRMGGASTNGWRTTLKINRSDLRALKANGCWSCLPLLYSRYLAKIWGFIFRG